jgi:aromatic-L-amino-acid decarboxylase
MDEIGRAALDFVVDFIRSRDEAPASDLDGAWDLAHALASERPPATGQPFSALLETMRSAATKATDTAGPGYLAFIPGGGLFASAVADFIACGVNRFTNLAAIAPAIAGLEQSVVRWMCDLFDYPVGSQGILTSGGSMANFSAIVTARTSLLPEAFQSGTLYVSDQAHASLRKAARLAGFPTDSIRVVRSTTDLEMDVDALKAAVAADRATGHVPFFVAANAGTTNTGSVDPIAEIANLTHDEGMWCHVDGAYGGFFQLTDRGRRTFSGIGMADSITLDPHKGLFLPYGTGSLLVRDGSLLLRAHDETASYLQDARHEEFIPDFSRYSPELSRDFRGLRVWLPLHLHGTDAFRAALDEKLDLTTRVYDALCADPRFEVPWKPELSLIGFRLRGRDDVSNRRFLEEINGSGRVLLSSTVVDGRMVIRVCILSHRTHRDRIDELLEIVKAAADRV